VRRARGLTLVELMIAIAVLAVLATLALPSFEDHLARRRVEGLAQGLRADLDLARSEAVQRNEAVTLSLGTNCYVLHLATATGACTVSTATVVPADARIRAVMSESAAVGLGALDGLAAIRFDATTGTADFTGADPPPQAGAVDVTATGRSFVLRVSTQRTGRTTLCVPAGSTIGGHPTCAP
jgi:prepilin-type N-terminal cleavage/methylation domain-containing protein